MVSLQLQGILAAYDELHVSRPDLSQQWQLCFKQIHLFIILQPTVHEPLSFWTLQNDLRDTQCTTRDRDLSTLQAYLIWIRSSILSLRCAASEGCMRCVPRKTTLAHSTHTINQECKDCFSHYHISHIWRQTGAMNCSDEYTCPIKGCGCCAIFPGIWAVRVGHSGPWKEPVELLTWLV